VPDTPRGDAVSVVIPVYNGEMFLAEAIESVYAQTVLPGEVVVVDDGSTDGTPEIVRRFTDRPGFRAVRNPHRGEASTRNAGIEHAAGNYVALLDHDDTWRPEKLERQLAHFDPAWGMSFTAYWRTSDATSELCCQDEWDTDPEAVINLLSRGCSVAGCSTALIRREALERAGPFEQSPSVGADWLMWLRIAAAGDLIGYLPLPLTEYRWHGNNASDLGTAYHDSAIWVFDRYGDRRLRAWWRLQAAIAARERQDRRVARRRIIEAAGIRPLSIRPGWVKLL
jgi:glycosyltransferase involved in cell wall biosynthesis